MKLKIILFTVIFTVFSLFAYSAEAIRAEAYGNSHEDARNNVLAELSFVMASDVQSVVKSSSQADLGSFSQKIAKQIDIISALPVYGADIKIVKEADTYHASASLLPEKVVPVYESKLADVLAEISDDYLKLQKEKRAELAYGYVLSILAAYENYNKLKTVLTVFGKTNIEPPAVSYSEIKSIEKKMNFRTDSLKHAASIISNDLKKDNVYVYYPVYEESDEITEFASVMRRLISSGLNSTDSLKHADYYIDSVYTLTAKGVYLSSSLIDKSGVTIGKSVVLIQPEAYKKIKVKPDSVSFEKLLKMGLAESSDFKVRLTTDNGKKGMLYRMGDTVELFVKLNMPGYFFIAGHVDKNGEKFSYLVDFYNSQGNRKFVRYVGADEVNRWISLGEFDIVPPFGLETFQMIGSLKDMVEDVPSYVFDPDTELYIISKNPEEGVVKTRAIKKKKNTQNVFAEDVLVFSTIEK